MAANLEPATDVRPSGSKLDLIQATVAAISQQCTAPGHWTGDVSIPSSAATLRATASWSWEPATTQRDGES